MLFYLTNDSYISKLAREEHCSYKTPSTQGKYQKYNISFVVIFVSLVQEFQRNSVGLFLTANTAIFKFICHSQSLQAALVVNENASELEQNECANRSTIHLDIAKKVPDVCTKGTQKSLRRPSRRSKGKFIVSFKATKFLCERQNVRNKHSRESCWVAFKLMYKKTIIIQLQLTPQLLRNKNLVKVC